MYGAELVAEGRFGALYAASGAVDHVRRDRYPVEFRPKRGGFLAQSVVVSILASQVSQSSPQQPIRWLVFFIVASIN